ncbi:MAG TPA: dTMP kinase [Spirochaetota bacterium]|nr:dTMP kinase [Spirochaetota bacterium]
MNILKNFIVFEGLDGAGTSTQSKLLTQKIPNSVLTCEPTGSEIGKLIRKILKKELSVTPKTLALLFAADRNEHIFANNGGIFNDCKNGKTVICDRYLFSSFAYQGLSLSKEEIFDLNKDFILPEVLFFLNTPIEECEKRVDNRNLEKEIFEEINLQEKILSNYLESFKLFEKSGMKIFELDGSLPIETLLEKELEIISLAGL